MMSGPSSRRGAFFDPAKTGIGFAMFRIVEMRASTDRAVVVPRIGDAYRAALPTPGRLRSLEPA